MAKPLVMILKEHGTNCERETQIAFQRAGGKADIVHMEDLIRNKNLLQKYQIIVFPGGFSFGDDTGSGLAWANRILNNLGDELKKYFEGDHLALGVCNGFQVMTNLGLLPGYGKPIVALEPNEGTEDNTHGRYYDRWVDVKFSGNSLWTKGIETISMPIAHGEGRFFAEPAVMQELNEEGLIAGRYTQGEICDYLGLPANPNGSLENVASITDTTGKLIGMMPHPERAMDFTQRPDWPVKKEKLKRKGEPVPTKGGGLKIIENGVKYFD